MTTPHTAEALALQLTSKYMDTKQMLPDALCHEAATLIRTQAAEIERLKMRCIEMAQPENNGGFEIERLTKQVQIEVRVHERKHAEIAAFRAAITKLHSAKGRYHTQLAACDLFDLVGLKNERPMK